MATRAVDVALRYAISIAGQAGMKQAIALSDNLATSSTKAASVTETSMKKVKAQYSALAKIAAQADSAVAKAAVDSSTVVNKALDDQIAKLVEAGSSYSAIIAKQTELGASAADLAAAVKRSSVDQIAAMRAVRAEADKPQVSVGQRLSGSSIGGKVGGAAATVAKGAGSLAFGGLALGAGLAYTGLEKSRGITEGTLAISGATGVSKQQALALSTIGSALGIAPRSIAQSFGTLGSQATKALAGNKTSATAFQTLGITEAQLQAGQNKPIGLFDLVTQASAKLPATQQAAIQRTLLGRGSSIVGQLTAGGSLGKQVGEVSAAIPGIDPKQLVSMQEQFVKLKEISTAFELSFAQTFGPTISKVLAGIIPLLKPISDGMKTAFSTIAGFFKSSTGSSIVGGLVTFGKAAYSAGAGLISAFKPAQPFFQNVLLPLVKGIAIGIGIGLVGAVKLVTAAVQVLAPVFGALGNVMAPLKGVIQDVGTVLGVLFSGDALGAIAKGLGGVADSIPFLGKVLEGVLKPVELVGEGIGGLYKIIAGTFEKILGYIPGIGGKLAGLLGGVATSIVGAFAAVPDQVGSLFSGLGNILGDAFTASINFVIGIVNDAIDAINAVTGAIPLGLGPAKIAHVGTIGGSPAPTNTSKAGGAKHGGAFAAGGWVPGDPTRDGTLAMLSGNEFVLTGHGQGMLDQYAPGLLDHIAASQLPHFATGGQVGASGYLGYNFTSAAKKPAKVNTYITPGSPGTVEHVTAAQYHAQEIALKVAKAKQGEGLQPKWSTIGATVYDDLGATSSGKHLSRGFAELSPAGIASSAVNFDSATALGRLPYGTQLLIRKGPNSPTVMGAKDDIGRGQGNNFYKLDMGRALAQAIGVSPSAFKGAIQVASTIAGAPLSALGATSAGKAVTPPTLSRATASLTPQSAFGAGYTAGLAGNTLMDTLKSGVLADALGDVAISKSGLVGGSTTATAPNQPAAGGSVAARMVAAASAIAARKYNYEWGGGHNSSFTPTHGIGHGSGPGIGYDCSGAVSAVLHAGGALKAPQVSGQFMNWGQAGKGKQVSVFSSPVHTFMQLAGRYFGTSTSNSGGGAGWLPGFPENMPATTHPPGLRRGGRIPGFRVGGTVAKALAPSLRTVSSLVKQPDSTNGQITTLMTTLAGQLDDVHQLTVSNLEALITQLKGTSRKGLDPIQDRRLDTAINLVNAAIGDRVALAVAAAQDKVDAIGRQKKGVSDALTIAGIDPSSTAGITATTAIDRTVAQGFNAQVGVLNAALATAKKYGDPTTIKTVTDALNTALGNLDDATAQVFTDWRAGVEQAAQDAVDASTQAVSVAQANEQILGLQQQIAGTDQSPGGEQQMADYITKSVIPQLQAQMLADQQKQLADQSVGDTAGVNQEILAVLNDQQNILSAQLQAQQVIKTNTDPLKNLGGSLGLVFNQQTFTDLGIGS